MPTVTMDANADVFLRRRLVSGDAILFTGAGFSADASNRKGESLLVGSALREKLWSVAFPGEPFDHSSDLGDIFDVGMRVARRSMEVTLRELFTVDQSSVPEMYRDYFSLPWYRIYTLNIDDLVDAVQRRFNLPTEIASLSAIQSELPPPDRLTAIHVNGRLADLPDVTFSRIQYGARTAGIDLVYSNLARELATHCTVFIGTQLDEPALWHHVALRGQRAAGNELRPKSFLVSPSLPPARAGLLEQFNVRHIKMTAEEFWREYVVPAVAEAPVRPSRPSPLGQALEDVGVARSQPAESPADFLLGREPQWGDIADGYAIEREFERKTLDEVRVEAPRIVVVTGTAGSGKSTTLRRMALASQADGNRVLWLRPESAHTFQQMRAEALKAGADEVFVDQAERFGARGAELPQMLAEAGIRVRAAWAASSFDDHGIETSLEAYGPKIITTPLLADEDIEALIGALSRANRLGRLAGLSHDSQVAELQTHCGRQLLVAMIEATSGERFEDKIAHECEALSFDLVSAYVVAALATESRYALSTEDLLGALSNVTSEGMSAIERLVRQHLLLRSAGRLQVRHPLIAREVLAHYRRGGQLATGVGRLAFVMASKFYSSVERSPERRLLTRLMNHDFLSQVIGSVIGVREVFQELESLLSHDFQFWLQRGSFELERGDIRLAENFLAQAKAYSGGSFLVQTEWAYLLLKRSRLSHDDPRRRREWAEEGIETLMEVIARSGRATPHTYVVLAREAITWSEAGVISADEAKLLLTSVRSTMADGQRHHAANRQFRQARDDLERAYLLLATNT